MSFKGSTGRRGREKESGALPQILVALPVFRRTKTRSFWWLKVQKAHVKEPGALPLFLGIATEVFIGLNVAVLSLFRVLFYIFN
jgi:hypothetical protein